MSIMCYTMHVQRFGHRVGTLQMSVIIINTMSIFSLCCAVPQGEVIFNTMSIFSLCCAVPQGEVIFNTMSVFSLCCAVPQGEVIFNTMTMRVFSLSCAVPQGEVMTIYLALPYVLKSGLYSVSLPNPANVAFNYYYYLCFIIFSYLPGVY